MAKTRRSPDGVYAGTGAVHQHDGKLPIYICNECEREVVWATSTRTGRKYLANVGRGQNGARFYIAARVHQCPGITDGAVAAIAEDARQDDYAAQYDDWTAAHYALDAKDRAAGRTQDADDLRDLLISRYRPVCPNEAAGYCPAHDYDHVLARRESQDDFNASWAAMKNEAARQERAQEAAAYLNHDV